MKLLVTFDILFALKYLFIEEILNDLFEKETKFDT